MVVTLEPKGGVGTPTVFEFPGADCRDLDEAVEIVAGVEIGAEFEGVRPDFFSMVVPTPPSQIADLDHLATLTFDGRSIDLLDASGTASPASGAFSATASDTEVAASVTYSCR